MINYDRERGGVTVHMESEDRVRTKLTVSNATPADSGNYTCDAANTRAASITVYVTKANQIAAIQPRAMDGAGCLENSRALMLALLVAVALTGVLH
ncbi:hypothetical protein Pcinc_026264 [Petrolisthes cinctipes]|uniref:Ig-like domain-containing protein n=1 Tax=Petrolisthes cinctipes TaxID=88211 RepID=A0AAE1F6G4_PETCI|nr:hypothetical protein Pcinc_026264 [Petrolisthes cinctipes]